MTLRNEKLVEKGLDWVLCTRSLAAELRKKNMSLCGSAGNGDLGQQDSM